MLLRSFGRTVGRKPIPSNPHFPANRRSIPARLSSRLELGLQQRHSHSHGLNQGCNISHLRELAFLSRASTLVGQTRWSSGGPSGRDRSGKAPGPSIEAASEEQNARSPWSEEIRSPAPGRQSATSNPQNGADQDSSKPESVSEKSGQAAPSPKSFADLPDIRQGLPSAFDALNSKSSPDASIKEEEETASEERTTALNITEDPERGEGRREGPKEAYVSSIDRRRQKIWRFAYLGAATFAVVAFAWLGREWDSEAEANTHADAPQGLTPTAWYFRFKERLGGQFSHYTEPAFPKLLPDQPADPALRQPYTLVLSLEDLLVSSTWSRQDGYKIAKRPGVDYFLRYLQQYYELVIFTTVQVANGDLVLRQLDPYTLCMPIFRDGTRYMNGEHVKDLSYLNRDLSKTIIIDTKPEHVRLQPENAIVLPKWTGKKEDTHSVDLVALIPFLEYVAGMELPDVRKVLASYKGKDIPQEFHRREMKAREEFNKSRKGQRASGSMIGLSGVLGLKATPVMQMPGQQSPMEAFAQGKMMSDQLRERGHQNYLLLEKHIKENGESWLKQRADEEKKATEEGMKNMTSGMFGFFGGGGSNDKK